MALQTTTKRRRLTYSDVQWRSSIIAVITGIIIIVLGLKSNSFSAIVDSPKLLTIYLGVYIGGFTILLSRSHKLKKDLDTQFSAFSRFAKNRNIQLNDLKNDRSRLKYFCVMLFIWPILAVILYPMYTITVSDDNCDEVIRINEAKLTDQLTQVYLEKIDEYFKISFQEGYQKEEVKKKFKKELNQDLTERLKHIKHASECPDLAGNINISVGDVIDTSVRGYVDRHVKEKAQHECEKKKEQLFSDFRNRWERVVKPALSEKYFQRPYRYKTISAAEYKRIINSFFRFDSRVSKNGCNAVIELNRMIADSINAAVSRFDHLKKDDSIISLLDTSGSKQIDTVNISQQVSKPKVTQEKPTVPVKKVPIDEIRQVLDILFRRIPIIYTCEVATDRKDLLFLIDNKAPFYIQGKAKKLVAFMDSVSSYYCLQANNSTYQNTNIFDVRELDNQNFKEDNGTYIVTATMTIMFDAIKEGRSTKVTYRIERVCLKRFGNALKITELRGSIK